MGMGGDFMFWYDASEISAEVLYPLAGYTFKKDLKVLEREQNSKKSWSSAVKDFKTLTHLNCQKEG